MDILCLADIHGRSMNIAGDYDYIFIAGDILERSDLYLYDDPKSRIHRLLEHNTCNCPILLTPGNHDPARVDSYKHIWQQTEAQNIHCLIDESYELKNGMKVFFTPWTPKFYNWNWMMDDDTFEFQIPDDTDIVVAHGPMYGYLDSVDIDKHVGSKALLKAVEDNKRIKYVVSGHIHGNDYESNRCTMTRSDGSTVICIRASALNEDYKIKPKDPDTILSI